jgi:hypothetical protein
MRRAHDVAGGLEPVTVQVRVSYYNPALGGINCGAWDDALGACTSRMASGQRWQDWIEPKPGQPGALACPREYPLWSTWTIEGRIYLCLDRGGRIITQADGLVRVDILAARPPPIEGRVWAAQVSLTARPKIRAVEPIEICLAACRRIEHFSSERN